MKLFLLIVLFSTNLIYAQELDLDKVIKLMKDNSENIKMAIYNKEYYNNTLKEVNYSRLGGLNFKTTYTNGDEPVYAFAQTMRQGSFSMASMGTINNPPSIENTEFALEAGFPIFTGFKISNYSKIAKKGVEISDLFYKRTNSGITFQAIYSYLTLLLRENLLKTAKESIDSSEREIKIASKLNSNGMILGSDYYAALAIYAGIKKQYEEFKGNFDTEKQKLAILTSLKKEEINLKGDLTEPNYNIQNLEELINFSLKERKELKIYKNKVEISKLNKNIEKNSLLGDLQAFGVFYGNTGKINSLRTSGLYGLKLNMPLGNPTYALKLKKADSQIHQEEENLNLEKEKIKIELIESYNNYITSLQTIKITKDMLDKAQESLKLFMPLFQQGKQSIMEVLRAESSLLQANALYLESLYKANLYYVQTMFYAEMLDEKTIKDISQNLSAI